MNIVPIWIPIKSGVEDFTYLLSCVLAIKYMYMHVPPTLHRQ